VSIKLKYSKKVKKAKESSLPILALESTIVAHGMPYPKNLEFATEAESVCEEKGVVPATIAIIDGVICVGLEDFELERIATSENIKKISMREIGAAVSRGLCGATTVSSTICIAHKNNIDVFSTGGIGGVHRGAEHSFDISQDLIALSKTPVVVVSAGAKSILDLSKTFELLETLGVSVVGFKTDEFPSFYSRSSGITGLQTVNSPGEIAEIFSNNIQTGLTASTLVANPVPIKYEIPQRDIDSSIQEALAQLEKQKIKGKNITPFLLDHIVKNTAGKSLDANIALAINNVRLGAEIAIEINKKGIGVC